MAPYMGTTGHSLLTITPPPPLIHGVQALAVNATTTAAGATAPLLFNGNSSAAPFAPTNGTNSSVIDRTCGATTRPFAVQVAQPGGIFDGWHLQLSADAVLFAPPPAAAANSSRPATQFSVEATGHLCVVGREGTEGNAIIAAAENATDVSGGAVYFADAAVLADDLGPLGYAPLACAVKGQQLQCAQGAKQHWVGCGLGLDITSDGDGVTEIGSLNCTGVTLAPLYTSLSS